MQFNPSCLAFSISTFMITSTYAQIEGNSKNDLTLPIMSFQANSKDAAFVGHTAKAVLRSDVPLFETAQSMSVMTKKQIEQKQAKTVAEALEGVAGVTSGQYGRRGWDDFIIRGQISSSQIYIDGLRIQTSTNVLRAEDLFGLESIEVVKGPTSVGFGLALPGGLVNLTTKRPQNKSFRKAQFSYGSHDFKEGTFDINYAPENNEKGAFRILGKISDIAKYKI